ncbi:MAG TPA: imidazole glycerol phosphate synthase subunit HisH [Gemmatimonadaceae bacterium]|jgi:glutamine amidotransferase|nr:imidazole glycerol phosphate synthase subunit HisH [Gemmatimonadaceae bacterium]
MRVTIFDYGAGNLHSLMKALEGPGRDVRVQVDPATAADTDLLVLPGVGAFEAATQRLAPGITVMRERLASGLPCLGICLGMQLLFERSEEGPGEGLGVIPGRVRRMNAARLPQIGWNEITDATDPVFDESGLSSVYYANSYVCEPRDPSCVVAWTTHEGDRFPAAVRSGNILGVQFHPEKSSGAGIAMLHAYLGQVQR